MNLFSRLAELLDLTLDDVLDREEDLVVAVCRTICEMEEGVAATKRYAAKVIAAERGIARDLQHNHRAADCWQRRARDAQARGCEDLARQALARKERHEALAEGLAAEHDAARRASDRARIFLRTLETSLLEAQQRQRSIFACYQVALARMELEQRMGSRMPDAEATVSEFERRKRELDAIYVELTTR